MDKIKAMGFLEGADVHSNSTLFTYISEAQLITYN